MWADNESKQDLLGFDHLASVVTAIIYDEDLLPATIGIFGDWGGGKSSLIELVKAKLTAKSPQNEDVIVLSFNGWLFEGYEGAKTALMGTILEELMERETVMNKAGDLLTALYRKVNWLKVTLGIGKLAAAYGTGGLAALGLGLGGGSDLLSAAKEVGSHIKDAKIDDIKGYLKDDHKAEEEKEARKVIRKFREEFAKVLEKADIKRLVVVIDDLDRCSPDTIIPTLEAIKLFLFVPNTAFIIGADEELVRYAVRRRFPELPGDRREVGRDYLEKLIQFPVRIPSLGRAEVESYLGLLFSTSCKELSKEQKASACAMIMENVLQSVSTPAFNLTAARELFKPMPEDLDDSLVMVERIAPMLGAIMNGNPRQCKRFLNTLLMRTAMAQSRSIKLQQRILAKLMLLEYFQTESFKQLAEWQSTQEGRPREIYNVEQVLRTARENEGAEEESVPALEIQRKPGAKVKKQAPALSSEEQLWLSIPWVKEWLVMEPMLANEDLAPYFYFSRDNLGMLGASGQRLSVPARRVLDQLRSPSQAARIAALKEVKTLSGADANAVFEALFERARREEDLGTAEASLKPMFDVAQERPEILFSQLVLALKQLPEKALPLWAPVTAMNAAKGQGAMEPKVREIVEGWSRSTLNASLAGAAKSALGSAK